MPALPQENCPRDGLMVLPKAFWSLLIRVLWPGTHAPGCSRDITEGLSGEEQIAFPLQFMSCPDMPGFP